MSAATDQVPVAFGGARSTWPELPADVRERTEAWLGAPVVSEVSARGGFSPGLASVLTTAGGRRVFLKAASRADHLRAVEFHRREAEVVAALPDNLAVPPLLWIHDDGEWVVAAYEALDGASPSTPWDPAVLEASVDAVAVIGDEPVRASSDLGQMLEGAPGGLRPMFEGWAHLRDAPDPALSRLVPWAATRLDELADLAGRGADAAAGDRLVHLDVRADNLVVAGGRPWVVDWAHATQGASWLDLAAFLPSVGMQGVTGRTAPLFGPADASHRHAVGTFLADVFASARHGSSVDVADVRAVIAGLAGYALHAARLPAVPGIPNLRPFQRGQGVAALAWLEVLSD